MKLNRTKTRASLLLLLTGAAGVIVGGPWLSIEPVSFLGFALLMTGLLLFFMSNRCPHCGATFRDSYWSKPDAGYCNKCGKKMEYDR